MCTRLEFFQMLTLGEEDHMFGPLEIRMGPYGSTCVTLMRSRVAKTAEKYRNISKEPSYIQQHGSTAKLTIKII